jgi:phage terminase large subunit-like protein
LFIYASAPPTDRKTASPIVLPHLINGESIAIKNLRMELDINKNNFTQTLYLNNTSESQRQAHIAVPVFGTLRNVDRNGVSITLDGKAINTPIVFADTWNEEYAETVDYDALMTASIQSQLEKLQPASAFAITSYDDQSPFDAYVISITGTEQTTVEIRFSFDPSSVFLFVDTGYTQNNRRGAILTPQDGEIIIRIPTTKDAVRTCRVLVVGDGHIEYDLPDEANMFMTSMTPYDFYSGHIYYHSNGSLVDNHKYELSNRFIERQRAQGESFIDIYSLAFLANTEQYMIAAVVSVDIPPQSIQRLEIIGQPTRGFITHGNERTYYYPIFSEGLNSFYDVGDVEIAIKPPKNVDTVQLMPFTPSTLDHLTVFTQTGVFNINPIIIFTTEYNEGVHPLLFFIIGTLLAIILLPVSIIALIMVILSKRRKKALLHQRKNQAK